MDAIVKEIGLKNNCEYTLLVYRHFFFIKIKHLVKTSSSSRNVFIMLGLVYDVQLRHVNEIMADIMDLLLFYACIFIIKHIFYYTATHNRKCNASHFKFNINFHNVQFL